MPSLFAAGTWWQLQVNSIDHYTSDLNCSLIPYFQNTTPAINKAWCLLQEMQQNVENEVVFTYDPAQDYIEKLETILDSGSLTYRDLYPDAEIGSPGQYAKNDIRELAAEQTRLYLSATAMEVETIIESGHTDPETLAKLQATFTEMKEAYKRSAVYLNGNLFENWHRKFKRMERGIEALTQTLEHPELRI